MRRCSSLSRYCIAASFLLAITTPSSIFAATLTWPGSPGCAGTLQACINVSANNDRIEIATNTPITESITIQARNLTLTAASGYAPVFLGNGIIANNSGSNADLEVRISKLRFENGYVTATYAGTGRAVFDLRELVLTRGAGASGHGIQVIAYSGIVDATLYNNRVQGMPLGLDGGLIRLARDGGTLNANAFYNHVTSSNPETIDGAGILIDFESGPSATSSGSVKLHANEVRGSYSRAGIFVSEGRASSTPSSFDVRLYSNVVIGNNASRGIAVTPKNGSINAQLVNNTVTRVSTGIQINNWSGGSTPVVSGLVRNNLLRAATAMFVNPGMTTGLTNDSNLFNGATINFTPGPNTITAPAALVSDIMPRLTAASPAIDAADSAALALGIIVNSLPTTDADGLRRFKRMTTGSKADIGAYEFGDLSLAHRTRPDGLLSHTSPINDPALNGRADANVFGVPNFNGTGSSNVPFDRPYGFWYPSGRWSIYDQDNSVAMPPNVLLNLFVPAAGSNNFRHTTSTDSVSAFSSVLNNPDLTNHPEMIVLVAQNWSAGSVYNRHPVGVFSFGFIGDSYWHVANLDQTDMPVGAGFSVYYQQPSPNAFRVEMQNAGILLTIDHPLLNGTPCARLIATRMWPGSAASNHFDAYYYTALQRWAIFSYATMPAGTQFNVLVDPAQVAECTDRIFANGFD